MSKYIRNAGAFYSYIAKGLGKPAGLGAAALAVFSYNAIQIGLYGAFVLGAVAGLLRGRTSPSQGFAFGPWMVLGAVLGPVVSAII
jgi:hypothetical protein